MSRVSQNSKPVQTLSKVRAGFTFQGTSLHAWCKAEGVDPSNARKALLGKWTGPEASKLLDRLFWASEGKKPC